MKKFFLWFRIIRPQTLFASLCPVLMGLLVVERSGFHADEPGTWATVVCALALQILSNLINDLYDFRRGTDRAGRKGFKRALAEGEVSERQMTIACGITLAVALLTGFYLVLRGGWAILLIGLTAILFAWLYTATTHSLSYLGIADIFVYLYYGVIATMGTIWIQLPYFGGVGPMLRQGFWAGSVCGLISMGVLMINNLRDIEDDRAAGKRTLPVRLGRRASECLMGLMMLLAVICAAVAFSWWVAVPLALLLMVLTILVIRAEGAQYNRCLMLTGIINFAYVLLSVFLTGAN